MTTTADTHKSAAAEHIGKAAEHLSEIVVNRCSGWDQYHPVFAAVLREALAKLIELREKVE